MGLKCLALSASYVVGTCSCFTSFGQDVLGKCSKGMSDWLQIRVPLPEEVTFQRFRGIYPQQDTNQPLANCSSATRIATGGGLWVACRWPVLMSSGYGPWILNEISTSVSST